MTAPDPRVDEIQARLEAATPGPWEARQDFIDGGVPDNSMTLNGGGRGDYIGTIALHYDVRAANAEFIAAAPADIAYLLAELRDRDEKLAKVEALCDAAAKRGIESGPPLELTALRAAVAAAGGGGE